MRVESMQHSLHLNISTKFAHKVNVKEYCEKSAACVLYSGYRMYTLKNSEIYFQDWLDEVNSKLPSPLTEHSFMFVRIANSESSVHMDFYPPLRNFIYGLNYVVDACDSSRMIWYEHIDGSAARLKYPLKPIGEVESVSVPSDNLLLVDTTNYHGIHVGDKDRWCMSLRTEESTYDPENPLSWADILQKYQEIAI